MFSVNGCNDGLIGFLFLFGIVCYDQNRFILSAFLLSLAILYKYIPLFALPILFIPNRRINWRFGIATIVFLIVGFGLSFYVWGEKLLNPLLFNSTRESKILSIFRYLRGEYSFLKFVDVENVDYLSTYSLITGVILIFVCHFIFNWKWLFSLVLTLLTVHLFYLVGHFQFYISFYFLLFFFLIKFYDPASGLNSKVILLCIQWLAGTTLLYGITEGFYRHFSIIREFIGLPHFLILSSVLFTLLAFDRNRPKLTRNLSES